MLESTKDGIRLVVVWVAFKLLETVGIVALLYFGTKIVKYVWYN